MTKLPDDTVRAIRTSITAICVELGRAQDELDDDTDLLLLAMALGQVQHEAGVAHRMVDGHRAVVSRLDLATGVEQ